MQFQPVVLGPLEVKVENKDFGRALKAFKRKLAREGLFKELKKRRYYEKPSERRKRKRREAERRRRKRMRARLRAKGGRRG